MASSDVSSQLSQHLLLGWAMLAEMCPEDDCAVPLLRSPDRTHMLCVNCHTRYPLPSPPARPPQQREGVAEARTHQQALPNGPTADGQERFSTRERLPNGPLREGLSATIQGNGPISSHSDSEDEAEDETERRGSQRSIHPLPASSNGFLLPSSVTAGDAGRGGGENPGSASEDSRRRLLEQMAQSILGTPSAHAQVGSNAALVFGSFPTIPNVAESGPAGLDGSDALRSTRGFLDPGVLPLDTQAPLAPGPLAPEPALGSPQPRVPGTQGPMDPVVPERAPSGPQRGPPVAEQGAPGSPARAASRPGSGRNEVAEKLLSGWAMLQDHCPVCYNPLMRARSGYTGCVVCKMPAVTTPVAEASNLIAAQPPRSQQELPARPAGESLPAGCAVLGGQETAQKLPGTGCGADAAKGPSPGVPLAPRLVIGTGSLGHHGAGTGARAGRPQAPVLGSSSDNAGQLATLPPAGVKAAVQHVYSSLVSHLTKLTQSLEAESDLRKQVQLLLAISECANAIGKVEGLAADKGFA